MPELRPLLTFAGLTVWEAARRRLLLAVLVLTVLVIAGTGWGFSQLHAATGPGGRGVTDLQVRVIASQVLIVLAFGAVSFGVQGGRFFSAASAAAAAFTP